jgi:hypothetical protein
VSLALGACAIAVASATGQSQKTEPSRCPVGNAETPTGGPRVEPPVKLQPDPNSQTRVVNFGTDRDPEFVRFIVTADPALPNNLEERLSLVADMIVRTGNESAESVTFPEPTFSMLRVSGNRERIRFDVCLKPPEDLPAGKYSGVVTLEGPVGVESAAVTITANAKNGELFLGGVVLTLLGAGLVLFYKNAADVRSARIEAAKDGTDEQKTEAESWGPALRSTLRDFGWWALTLFVLGATFGTLYALWEANPAWGESGVGSVVALIGAGLAAVGAKAVFTPSVSK